MKLRSLLTEGRVVLPLDAGDLRAAVRALCARIDGSGGLSPDRVLDEVLDGEGGTLTRIDEALLLAAVGEADVEKLALAVGVSPTPFRVETGDDRDATLARGLLLVVSPERLTALQVQAIPTLIRFFRSGGRARALLEAATPEDVLAVEGMAEVEVHDRLLVEDALVPLQYRVYPETPMDEVVDLMVRRELHAVPVVGENQEVMGIITGGDALAHLLPRRMSGKPEGDDEDVPAAREVMSRSVLCVSEDQSLVEAANMMINKDVDQLPVVREGELIGMLTRETVLRHLFGR